MKRGDVTLGLMSPLTGVVSIYGEEISRAAQIACAEINEKGGVLGKPLKLVVEDDGSLPESAVAAAERLIHHHRCVAIIGNLLSNSRIAVAYRVAEPRRIPYLNFSFYEGSILSRYFFHFAALPNQQIDRMIPYMRREFGPRMYFAGNNYEWPRGSIHAAKLALEQAGGQVVGEEYCPIGVDAGTIERLLDHVEETVPDVFVPYFAGTDQVNLLTRFCRRGLKQRVAVVMGHYDEVMASTLPAEVREGFYSSNTYFMSVDTVGNRDCLARLARLPEVDGLWPNGNGILTNFGEGAYVCVKAFAQTATRAGSLDPEALVNALETVTIEAPQGPVQMNPESHHARVNTYLTRCESNGTFSIIEKFGAIDPLLPERYKHQELRHRATLEEDIRLQARILEQLSEGILLTRTKDITTLWANAGAERLFGYGKGEMIGLPLPRLFGTSDACQTETAADLIESLNHKGEWHGEIRYVRRDGSPFWCYSTITTFTHPVHGEVWLTVQHDITMRKLAEAEQARLREQLQQSQKMEAIGRLAGGVAHDFNNLLTVINGYTDLALRSLQVGDPLQAELQQVRKAGDRAASLTRQLLAFSRWQPFQPMALDLNTVVQDAEKILRRVIGEDIEFTCILDPALGTVKADPGQIHQVLMNLVVNARDAMPTGGKLVIETANLVLDQRYAAGNWTVEPGSYVVVSMSDTGIGMSKEVSDRLFEPFFTTKEQGKGTGLGLATVFGIVKSTGGHISVYSEPGQGTIFRIYLPRVTEAVAEPVGVLPDGDSRGHETILVVEDQPEVRQLTSSILRSRGYQVLEAEDGIEALRLCEDHGESIDLIVTDVVMPKMGGPELVERLTLLRPKVQVLYVSGYLEKTAMPLGGEGVPIDYLQKPYTAAGLAGRVREMLDKR